MPVLTGRTGRAVRAELQRRLLVPELRKRGDLVFPADEVREPFLDGRDVDGQPRARVRRRRWTARATGGPGPRRHGSRAAPGADATAAPPADAADRA
ncbi:hypothetical protein [Streptomyces swartbergensis]|uniref:hypothetical protein n=1 Tax=Streptomyces swartbergensis TaxID=487165 RepID=UPI0037F52EAF